MTNAQLATAFLHASVEVEVPGIPEPLRLHRPPIQQLQHLRSVFVTVGDFSKMSEDEVVKAVAKVIDEVGTVLAGSLSEEGDDGLVTPEVARELIYHTGAGASPLYSKILDFAGLESTSEESEDKADNPFG